MSADRYSDGSREIRYFTQSIQMLSSGIGTVSDVLYKTLALLKDDPVNRAIADSLKHDDAVVFEVDNFEEAEQLRKKLSSNGVEFTATAAYKESVYVVVPKCDLERATEVVNDFYDSRSQGIFTADYINTYANGEVREIRGLSEEEATLYVERCKDMHVPVNVEGPADGLFRIRFAEKDLDKMERVRLDTALSMQGPAGGLYQQHLNWQNEYNREVLNAVITGKFPDGRTVPEGCALVGRDGKRVEVTKQYIKIFEGGSSQRFSRNADADTLKKNTEQISRFVKGIDHPVFLNSQEYTHQMNMDTRDRDIYFANQERIGFLLPRDVYKRDLVRNAAEGRSPDGAKFHKGDVIIDDKGNRVEYYGKEIKISRSGNAPVTVPIKGEEAFKEASEAVEAMHNPVYLSASKAKELEQAEDRTGFIREQEISEREYVKGRPELTEKDISLLAKAEAMRHEVEVHLKHDGIELPKTERMTYHDAAQIFGLAQEETESLNTALQQEVTTEFDQDSIRDVVDQVEAHFGVTEPHDTVIPISRELEADAIFEDRDLDTGFDLGNDAFMSDFDLDEF